MLPIYFDLKGKSVLLVGAGRVGRRKLKKLLEAGANVLLVEPSPGQEIKDLAASGAVTLVPEFSPTLLTGQSLVLAASSHREQNRLVAEAARAMGIWVNVADAPELSDFFLPAMVAWGDFQISVGTGGHSPALAAKVAAKLRQEFGPEYGRLTTLMAQIRPLIMASGLTGKERETIFKTLAESEPLRLSVAQQDEQQTVALIKALICPISLTPNFKLDWDEPTQTQ